MRAELPLVLVGVIMFLHKRMGIAAVVTLWAFFSLLDERTHLTIVVVIAWPLAVLGIVVIYALLVVMVALNTAEVDLKHLKV